MVTASSAAGLAANGTASTGRASSCKGYSKPEREPLMVRCPYDESAVEGVAMQRTTSCASVLPPKAPVGQRRSAAAPQAAGRQALQARKLVAKPNPFMEYDTREKRLARERHWLQEDDWYLRERQEDMRHGAQMKRLVERAMPDQELYEKRLFFGPYSLQLQAARAARGSNRRPATADNGIERALASVGSIARISSGKRPASANPGEDRDAAQHMRRLQQELKSSCNEEVMRQFSNTTGVAAEPALELQATAAFKEGLRRLFRNNVEDQMHDGQPALLQ